MTTPIPSASELHAHCFQLVEKAHADQRTPWRCWTVDEGAELRKQVFGPDNADYAASLNNLANNYEAMGMPEKAEPLLLQARAIYEKALGIGHPHYIKHK